MDGLSPVSSMDGLSPVSYQNALDPTTTNDNGCQVCSDDFKRVMRLRGNDINAQLNFFSNNLRHKDFSLLELREQVRARCASVSCLKEAVTKGDVYNKLNLPTCKSFGDKIKSLPDEAQSFLSYLQGLPDVNGFLDMLDKCLAEVTTAVKNFDGNIENTTAVKNLDDNIENSGATKAGLDALSNIAKKFKDWAKPVKAALTVYNECKDIFDELPSAIEEMSTFTGKIDQCIASIETVRDALPKYARNFVTEVGKFKEAIESVIQITENFPITIDEWNDKFIELDVSLKLISKLNLPQSAKEKIDSIVKNIKGYADIAKKLLKAFSFDMNLDIKSIQDKLRELNDAANEVKNSKVKMPEQIKLIATKATEYTPILQKLIDTVSTIPANDGDIRNTIKLVENKIKDTRAILVDISNLQKLPSKVGTIVNSTERFLSLAEGGTKVIQACLGVTDIFQNSTLEWDTLVSGIDKLNACKSGIESITFGDPKQQGQQQGGFLQNIEAKLNTIKNKVLELTEPFFKLINVVPVCTNAAKTLNSKDLKKCAKAIKEMPIFKEKGKGKNIKTAVSASIKIMADCKDIFDLDFDLNSLLQTVKELQKEFKTCLNTVDKEMKALGKFGEAVRKKVKKIQDFKTKIENMGAMAIVSAISNCNEMITNKNALKNAVEELPSLETEIEAGKDIYTWVESTHKLVDELIQTGKGNAEEITGLFKNLQSSAKKCFDSISAVTDLIPEKWQIRSRLENLGTKWKGHLKLSSKALISNSWWTKTKSWGKRLARGAAKVIRAATKVASKVFRLAGVLLEPLTQCIATLSEDDEETYKSAWRNCFEAACKQFDDSMVNAAAAFAGATAATPLCAKVALATSAIPVVGTAGGGSICLISAGAIAAEAADRAYQNSNIDEAADKACEGYLDIQVSDVTDELIDKVDKVMEMVSCPRLLDQQREENDLGECRRKDGAGSWWTCDTSNDCEPDPDNPCRGECVCDEEWNNSCECVSTSQKVSSC